MQIAVVKAELASAVRDPIVPGLGALDYTPDAVSPPVFYTGEAEIDPNFVFGGAYLATITCRVITSRSDDLSGQHLLDEYLSKDGPTSVIAALLAARGAPGELALNGAADDLSITQIAGYRLYQVGDGQFYGAEIRVRVVGS